MTTGTCLNPSISHYAEKVKESANIKKEQFEILSVVDDAVSKMESSKKCSVIINDNREQIIDIVKMKEEIEVGPVEHSTLDRICHASPNDECASSHERQTQNDDFNQQNDDSHQYHNDNDQQSNFSSPASSDTDKKGRTTREGTKKQTNTNKTKYLKRSGECEVCKKYFVHLERHQAVRHNGDTSVSGRPFVCDHPGCVKAFKLRRHLQQHQTFHTKRNFICENCGAACYLAQDLRRHMISRKCKKNTY